MELTKVASDAIGALEHATLTCYRCTKQETFAGDSEEMIVKAAVRKGWRRLGDRLICKRCGK